jgi:hypothetical protein
MTVCRLLSRRALRVSEATEIKSVGQQFMPSLMRSSRLRLATPVRATHMELKTAIINATGQNQPLVPSDRLSGHLYDAESCSHDPRRPSGVVARTATLLSSRAKMRSQTTRVRKSAVLPEAYENVTKPESGITFTLVNEPVVTLAHFIPVSKQVMAR